MARSGVDWAAQIETFLRESLRPETEVAPMSLIRDSQTKAVLDWVAAKQGCVDILDLGCGALRLLHALITTQPEAEWTYIGVDLEDPATARPDDVGRLRALNTPQSWRTWSFDQLQLIRGSGNDVDLVVVMNVLHELGVYETARLLNDARRFLRPDGTLLLIDLPRLIEGEHGFVPWFPHEFSEVFTNVEDLSFRSPSGALIAMYAVPRDAIPCYWLLPGIMSSLLASKISALTDYTARLLDTDGVSFRTEVGLGESAEFDLMYLHAVTVNATRRRAEAQLEDASADRHHPAFADAAIAFVRHVQEVFEVKEPTVEDVFDALVPPLSPRILRDALRQMSSAWLIFPIETCDAEIRPTHAWDYFEDMDESEIRAVGLRRAASTALEHSQDHWE